MQCQHFNHRFLNIAQVAFWAGEEAGNEFTVPGDHLKLRILNLSQVAISDGQERRKRGENAMRAPETWISRIYQVVFLDGQEADKELTLPGDQLKHRILDLTQIEICAEQETKNELKVHCGTCNITFLNLP